MSRKNVLYSGRGYNVNERSEKRNRYTARLGKYASCPVMYMRTVGNVYGKKLKRKRGFPGGSVVKNPNLPARAGDMSLIPGPKGSHILRNA